jgi:hypothetical protein
MARAGKIINLAQLMNGNEEALRSGIEFDEDEYINAMSIRMSPVDLYDEVGAFFKIPPEEWTRDTAASYRMARAKRNCKIVKDWKLRDPVTGDPYDQPWNNMDVFLSMPEPMMSLLEAAISIAYDVPEAKREEVGEG